MTRPFGGIVTRAVALTIDGAAAAALFAIGTVAVSLAFAALGIAEFGTKTSLAGAGSLWVLFVIAYFVVCWSTSGQTLGMRMMGLRIINADGRPPSVCRSTVRYFARFLSIALLFTGYLLILVHPRRRTLHDLIAGTYVVYADASPDDVAAALDHPVTARPESAPPGLTPATDRLAG